MFLFSLFSTGGCVISFLYNVDFTGSSFAAAGDLIKRGTSMIQTDTGMLNELKALAEDTIDAKMQQGEIIVKSVNEMWKLITPNTLDSSRPKTPQQKKNVDQRQGQGE